MLSELLRWVVKERSPAAQLAAVRQRLDRKWDIALSDTDFGSTANYLNDVLGRVLDLQTGRSCPVCSTEVKANCSSLLLRMDRDRDRLPTVGIKVTAFFFGREIIGRRVE